MSILGRKIIRLESVDSTNNYTANLVKKGELVHGSVILAVEQTSGRGQMGASWVTKPGENLTMSLFLDDVNLSVSRQFFLTKIVSLSLVDFLSGFGVEAKIKWPNDIYVKGRKIAGILIENSLKGTMVKQSVIGIGLNVNQTEFGSLNATSLKLETGKAHLIDELLYSLLGALNNRYDQDEDTLSEDYLDRLYQINEVCRYEDSSGVFEGKITGIDDMGYLLLEKNGGVQKYDLKEIRFLS